MGGCWSGVGEIDTNSKILFRVCNEMAMKNAESMKFLDIFLLGGNLSCGYFFIFFQVLSQEINSLAGTLWLGV